MKKPAVFIALLLAIAVVWAVTSLGGEGGAKPLGPAPDITIGAAGGPVRLAALKGRVVVIDFWATWCGPCRVAIPSIERLYRKYHPQGLEVMGVALENDRGEGILPFVKELGITYPVGMPTTRDDALRYRPDNIPLLVVVDKKGEIRYREVGFSGEMVRELDDLIKKLLAE